MARRDLAPRLIDATVHRFEPLAPDWLVRVVAPKQAPVPWPDMVRVAVSVTVPLAVGMLAGQVGIGSFAAMGALLGAFGDAGGPFGRRFRRALIGLVCALVGLLAGRLLLTQGLAAVPVAAVFGVISALLSGISAEFSFGGLQLLVYLAIAAGPAHAAPLPVLVAAIIAGAAWSMLLSFVQTLVVPVEDRPPLAVAAVLSELIALLTLLGGRGVARRGRRADGPAPDLDRGRPRLRRHRGGARDRPGAAAGSPAADRRARRRDAARRRRRGRRAPRPRGGRGSGAGDPCPAGPGGPAAAGRCTPPRRRGRGAPGARSPGRWTSSRRPAARATPASPAPPARRLRDDLGQALTGRRTWLFAARLGLTLAVGRAGLAAAAPGPALLAAAHHGGRAEARLRLGLRPRPAAHPRHARSAC